MKVILTGASGFVGTEVLRQCIQHDSITSIVVLTRREISIKDSKLEVVIFEDFLQYSVATRERHFADADACIWCLGIAGFPKTDEQRNDARKISIDYTMAGVHAMLEARKSNTDTGTPSKPFRFLYLSGKAIVGDQDANLWFYGPMRKLRGELEQLLPALCKERPDELESSVSKPGMVLDAAKQPWKAAALQMVMPTGFRITVDVLARALIKQVLEGFTAGEVVNNDGLIKLGSTAAD